MILRSFAYLAERTSYCFAFVPFAAASGYFAASYAFFMVYLSVERFEPGALEAFGLTLGVMLALATGFHAAGFGAFERAGVPSWMGLPRRINRSFRRLRNGGELEDRELVGLLEGLARFPGYHMRVAASLAATVTLPSVGVEYAFSRSLPHMASGMTGGVIAGVLYCYFCCVITEALSADLRKACRRTLCRRGARLPRAHGISLRGKIGFAVGIVFFSMGMLVYFLWFCRASLMTTAGFMITTLLTAMVLVALHFRSVNAAFEEILRTARSVSRGGGDLLHLGNNEKELVEFLEHFNVSVRETIALRRDLEAQVRERTLDLEAKARELGKANERLLELDRLKSRFLSSVSHELRTPLTAILGFVRIVRRDFDRSVSPGMRGETSARAKAERIAANLDVVQQEGDRLMRLINDVLDLARIESGRMVWQDERLDIARCVRHAARIMEGAAERRPGVGMKIEADGSLPPVLADPDRITQVLVNLMGNAFKFTEAGEVRVCARRDGPKGVRVAVEDTGLGIAREELERVFERFHQEDRPGERPGGTGLGLAISREIVEHYGGCIRAEPRRTSGTRFVFSLPVEGRAR